MRFIAAVSVFTLGAICFKSSPGPIVRYLHKHAKSPKDYASGLKVAMTVRRALGIFYDGRSAGHCVERMRDTDLAHHPGVNPSTETIRD